MVQFSNIKSTGGPQVLHYKLSHRSHIKNSISYRQVMIISRLCSVHNDFNAHISNLKDWLLVSEQPSPKDTSGQCVPFVVTYHPKLKDLGKLIKKLHLFFSSDSEARKDFSPASGLLTDGETLHTYHCNDETWHCYTLPKEPKKFYNHVRHPLRSADISIFPQKSSTFVISRNTDTGCILIHNF